MKGHGFFSFLLFATLLSIAVVWESTKPPRTISMKPKQYKGVNSDCSWNTKYPYKAVTTKFEHVDSATLAALPLLFIELICFAIPNPFKANVNR